MTEGTIEKRIHTMATDARRGAGQIAVVRTAQVNRALRLMARLLDRNRNEIRRENERDLIAARAKGLSPAMVDRLTLGDKAFASMIRGLREVAALPSPVGEKFASRRRPNGLKIHKVRVPIGVVAIIYESRPNVTVDAAAICLKSQNAVILRGGSEAFHSNRALAALFSHALEESGLPAKAAQLVPTTDRAAVDFLLRETDNVDLVIPRGGEGLIRAVVEKSLIPVIKHYKGVCHVFVSRHADMKKALPIAVNAKVQRPGVCNAMETLLIDKGLAAAKQKALVAALQDAGAQLKGDAHVRALANGIARATEEDWYAEYLDLRLAVRAVAGLDEAVEHINRYGSRHTDAIVTESATEASAFLNRVDSSSVMLNASTRFSDGGEYGMGCEIGISTDKLHSRGPMGIEDLTTYKWVVVGSGHVRT